MIYTGNYGQVRSDLTELLNQIQDSTAQTPSSQISLHNNYGRVNLIHQSHFKCHQSHITAVPVDNCYPANRSRDLRLVTTARWLLLQPYLFIFYKK